jgi:hypothetical protein
MEDKLINAVRMKEEEGVRKILEEDKDINVNSKDDGGWTALHWACTNNYDRIVAMLLAHPDIDVNQKTHSRITPFWLACRKGNTLCVRSLLKDERVLVNEPSNYRYTSLYWAAYFGYLETIKWLIASGREVNLGEPGDEHSDAIGGAEANEKPEVVSLLEKFRDHQTQTRHEIRIELGWFNEKAAELFSMVIFLCDGLMELKDRNLSGKKEIRCFNVARKLPMEIQMVLSHRVAGSMVMNIPVAQRELGFKNLVKELS